MTLATTTPPPDQLAATAGTLDFPALEKRAARSQSLYALIAGQPFFNGLKEQQLQLLADCAVEMKFEAGHSFFQEESPDNRFYLILRGKVALESGRPERELFPIQMLGPGDELGWSWLFPSYHLKVSARAVETTHAIFFYAARLREQCETDHELGYQLSMRIAVVVIQRLQATQARLIECIDKHK